MEDQTHMIEADRATEGPAGRRSRRSWRREHGQKSRGAVLVETVIVISLLLLLLFGVAEFGMVLRSKHGLAEATRAGARAAAALPRDDGFNTSAANAVRAAVREAVPNQDVETLVIYRANGDTGEPVTGSSVENCGECFKYEWNPATSDWDLVAGTEWLASTQWACGKVNETDFVGVEISGTYDFVTAFWADEMTLTSRAIMRLEPVTGTSVCGPGSNPPPTAAPTSPPTTGPTRTPTLVPSSTPTATPWATGTPAPTATPTATPPPTSTPAPTPTSPAATPTPTAVATPDPNGWDPDTSYYYPPWNVWTYVWYSYSDLPPQPYPSGCTYYGYWHGGSYHSGGYEIYCTNPVGPTPTPTVTPTPSADPFDWDFFNTRNGAYRFYWYSQSDIPPSSAWPADCYSGPQYSSYYGAWRVYCTSYHASE